MKQSNCAIALALGVAVTVSMLGSCASTRTLERMIPEETAVYVQIPEGELLLADLDDLLTSIGLGSTLSGMSLYEFLVASLAGGSGPLHPGSIDLSQPIGMAIIPPESPTAANPEFIIFLPLKEIVGADTVVTALAEDPTIAAAVRRDYLVLFSTQELAESFPPRRRTDVRALRAYPANTVQLFVDVQSLLSSLDLELHEVTDAIPEDELQDLPWLPNMLDAYMDLVRSMSSLTAAAHTGSPGVLLSGSVTLTGNAGRFVRGMSPAGSLTDVSFPHLEDALMRAVFSMAPEDSLKLTEAIAELFVSDPAPADGADNAIALAEYVEQMRTMTGLSTGFVAMSMTTGSPGPVRTGKPNAPAPPVPEVPSPQVAMVIQITNAAAFEEAYLTMDQVETPFDYTILRRNTDSGFEYLEIETDAFGMAGVPGAEQLAGTPFPSTFLHVDDQFAYFYMGHEVDGLEQLTRQPLVQLREPESRLPGETGELIGYWELSTSGFLRAAGLGPTLNPPQLPISGHYAVDGRTLRGATLIPAEQIMMFIQLATIVRQSAL